MLLRLVASHTLAPRSPDGGNRLLFQARMIIHRAGMAWRSGCWKPRPRMILSPVLLVAMLVTHGCQQLPDQASEDIPAAETAAAIPEQTTDGAGATPTGQASV